MKVETVVSDVSGQINTNCYLVYDESTLKAIVIDPGLDPKTVIEKIKELKLIPELLVNTHGHFDHIYADDDIRSKYHTPLAVSKDEVDMLEDPELNASAFYNASVRVLKPEMLLTDGEIVKTSFTEFKVIHTPGHTKGCICLLFDKFLITGDTLFKMDVGRTDLKTSSHDELVESLGKLKKLDPSLIIYPGHGQSSTLDEEIKNNKHLG
jgi:glyoxylase-like metal-dependent hydrolase (beta-lactamase superfamily II)